MDPTAPRMPPSQPPQQQQQAKAAAPPKPHNGCPDAKPRLTKEQHEILEAHYLQHHKPPTQTKKGFAEALGVPLDKINNWFQNRRAKAKHDAKKLQNQNQFQMGMNMSMYQQAPHMSMPTSQFSAPTDQMQQQQQQQQQQQMPVAHDYFPMNADVSPSSHPVQSVEGPSALDLGSQLSLQHMPFETHHSLRPIPEAERHPSYQPDTIMRSLMAATAGPSYMQNSSVSLPPHAPGFSFDTTGLPQNFAGDYSFPVPQAVPQGFSNDTPPSNGPLGDMDFGNFDFGSLTNTNTSSSAEVQNSTGSHSSEPSPFSGTQSTATTQSSSCPNASSVASLTSVYSGWKEENNPTPDSQTANGCDGGPFEPAYDFSQEPASVPFWTMPEHNQHFSQSDFYQHPSASANDLCPPEQSESRKVSTGQLDFEALPVYGDEAYARRNSSTTNLATNIEAIQIQSGTPDGFKQPHQGSSIAARRHKRPTALNSSTLRSASYTNGMHSPGNNGDHTLRKIRSSGISNAAGRVQKPSSGSAQRSPMTHTFAEAAASPKFSRSFSSSSNATVGQGGSLAPPTPLTPNEMGRFPCWQNNTVIRNHQPMPEHSSPESLNANWAMDPQSGNAFSTAASPPSTPSRVSQLNPARLADDSVYRDTPPQSAPATQQSFPHTAFVQPPQMRAGFRSTTDLTLAQPKPSHFRRPSLPDTGHSQLEEANMQQYPVHYPSLKYDDLSLQGISHNVPFAPPVSFMPDFPVHEYTPPQGTGPHTSLLRRPTEPQPKSYVFANAGPHDFRS